MLKRGINPDSAVYDRGYLEEGNEVAISDLHDEMRNRGLVNT
jgi:hypothetical protein